MQYLQYTQFFISIIINLTKIRLMSDYRSFYNTLNALQAQNQAKRNNINAERANPYTSQYVPSKFLSRTEFNTENKLRRSRHENQRVQSENSLSRHRINEELYKSEQKQKQADRMTRMNQQIEREKVEYKQRSKIQAVNLHFIEESARTRSSYLDQLENSRRKVHLTQFTP